MRLTKTAAHAALALAFIADHQADGAVQARDISAALGASTQSILKVLGLMAQAKLVASKPGRGGGYRLPVDAGAITLLSVVEAVDGSIDGWVQSAPEASRRPGAAALERVARDIAAAARRHLAGVTIADLTGDAETSTSTATSGGARSPTRRKR